MEHSDPAYDRPGPNLGGSSGPATLPYLETTFITQLESSTLFFHTYASHFSEEKTMDARLAREELVKNTISISTRSVRPQTWYEWFWRIPAPSGPKHAEDAAQDLALRGHFLQMLDQVEPPDTFKPSEVADLLTTQQLQSLGYVTTDEALPAVYTLAWELRAFGACEILRKGVVLGEDIAITDLDGPVRIRRLVD